MRPARPLALAALLLLLAACSSKPPDEGNYVQQIERARAAKDAMMRGPESPIAADKRAFFVPLSYYAVDPRYAVAASLAEAPPGRRPQMEMETSAHQPRRMERVGVLKFNLDGQPLQLGVFVEAGESTDMLFVPFADATSGTETYAGGRYLDIPRSPTGFYTVDFNKAFNPYCYYNPTYDCPYPPKENRLAIPIRAGEKVKEK